MTVIVLAAMIVPISQLPAGALPVLAVTPITWGVIGLDSNNVNSGPNTFASGARVCNTGTTAATNVVATYNWTTANANINLYGSNPLSTASIAAGSCFDFYFNIAITRTSAAYDTTRGFRIDVTATGLGTISTPTPRELYVEKLVSQNRNSINSITGPTTVAVGGTYTYVLDASTANGGYEQFSSFINFPNSVFQIVSVNSTYTAPSGGTNDTIYGDACGWNPVPGTPTYRSCVGPVNYPGGKVGGDTITTYQVKILAVGSSIGAYALIYDKSGNSYHYNNDYGAPGSPGITINAVEQSDLSITKSDSPDPVIAGNNVTYTLQVANAGPSTARNVTVTDPLPGGTSFVSADNGGSLAAGTVTWNLGDIASGGTATLQLVVKVNANRTANISNTASAATTSTDPVSGNNSATAGTTVTTSANLSITKTDSPDPVGVGQNLTYTLAVANAGPSDAQSVVVTDTLPAGVTFVSATPSQGSCSQLAGVVTCPLGTVAAGATPSVSVVVTPNFIGSITNSASVTSSTTDPALGNNSDSQGTTVQPRADLSVTKGDSPDPVVAGNQLTYTMVVANGGPSTAQSVVLTDPIPAGTSFVSADGGGTESGGTVTWNLGNMVNGASTTVHLVVAVNPGRTTGLSNTATVASSTTDPNAANDNATQATVVGTSADLSITKSDSPDPVGAGQALTYTVGVANAGPSVAQSVSVTDLLPAGVAFVSATPTVGSCGQFAGVVTCSLGDLAVSSTATISIVVTAPAGGGSITNSASVTSLTSDPDSTDNSATAGTTVTPRADLSITKSDSVDPVTAGNDLTYTLSVANAGPSTAQSVVVVDAVPAGTTFVSATPSVGGCGVVAGTVICALGDLVNGGTATVTVVVHVPPSRTTPLSNTAGVSSSTADPNSANDGATEGTGVVTSADLSISKSDDADPVLAGTDLTYTIVVTNDGPSDAANVVVTDAVPAGTSFVSADAGGIEAAGTVTWNLGGLASGASTTVHLTVHVDPALTLDLSNTASVTSSTSDPNAANDSDTEATVVALTGDLAIAKSDGVTSVTAGASTVYTLSLTNVGASTVPAGVVVTDAIPAGTTGSEFEADCSISIGVMTCTSGVSLAPGDSVSWNLTVDVDANYALATIDNTAEIVSASVIDTDGSNDSATDSDDVDRLADLSITKSDDADPVVAGTDLTYTIVVTNDGPSDAANVVVTDAVPAGTSFVSADAGGIEAAGTVTWTLGTIANGDTTTVHVTVAVAPGRTADLSNTAQVTSDTPDPDAGDLDATEITSVTNQVDLAVTQSDDADPVQVGTDVVYTVVVANAGPSSATAVAVTDTLPAGTTFVSATPSQGSCSQAAGVVSCSLGSIAPGGVATIDVQVTTTAAGTITNDASVTTASVDTDASNDEASEDTLVSPLADLSITKSDDADPVVAGTDLTYTIVVTNDGPSDAANVVVTDAVPAGTSFVSADAGGIEAAGTVTWTLGTIANGDTTTVHVTVAVAPGRTADLSNTAQVASPTDDPDPSNDSATEDTLVSPLADLSITKTASAPVVGVGDDITYTLDIHNAGPSDATNVTVSDTLPVEVTFVSATPSQGTCSEALGVATCDLGTLLDGADASISIVTTAATVGTTDNTATVAGDPTDTDPSDDADDATVTIDPAPVSTDLSIVKTDLTDPVTVGTNLTYTLAVHNDGPDDATGVTVSDPLALGATFVSSTPSQGSCLEAAATVTCDLGDVAAGGDASITLVVTSTAAGALDNTATVNGDQPDPDPSNDSSTASTTVDPAPVSADLSLTKSDDADPITAGTDLTYTITVTNAGPDQAADVTVSDDVPAGATFVSADMGGTEVGGTVTWNLGDVANGAVVTVHVTVHVDPSRKNDLTNTASVATVTSDPEPSNDSDTEGTLVVASANLAIDKSAAPDPVMPGDELTYTLVVSNAGPSTAAGVTVSDALPAGTSFVSADNGGSESGGTVTWNLGSVDDGDSRTLTLVVRLSTGYASSTVVNTAAATADTPDPDPSDNADTATVADDPAELVADLAVAKTSDVVSPRIGDTITYTISVTNHGPADATGVVIGDDLPTSMDYMDSRASQGSYSRRTGAWTLGSLADGATATLEIDVVITGGGTIRNVADVNAVDQRDPDDGNDTGTRDVQVLGATGTGSGGSGNTAFTGAELAGWIFLAIGLVVVGAMALAFGARRRRDDTV